MKSSRNKNSLWILKNCPGFAKREEKSNLTFPTVTYCMAEKANKMNIFRNNLQKSKGNNVYQAQRLKSNTAMSRNSGQQ